MILVCSALSLRGRVPGPWQFIRSALFFPCCGSIGGGADSMAKKGTNILWGCMCEMYVCAHMERWMQFWKLKKKNTKNRPKRAQAKSKNHKLWVFTSVLYTSVLFYCTFKSFCSLLNIFLCLHNTTDVTGCAGGGKKRTNFALQIRRGKQRTRGSHSRTM